MIKIKHYAKVILVGFSFIFFGLICFFGNLVFLPITVFKLNKFKSFEKFSRQCVRFSWGIYIKFLILIKYMKVEYIGFEKLGQNGQLIIANHPSLLDVVLIMSKVKNLNCVVKPSLKKNFLLFTAVIKACNYILSSQDEIFLNKSINVLKNDECLLIFPEGTRTQDEIKMHKSAAYIAIKGAKKITPIFIKMNPRSLKKGQTWYNTPNVTISYEIIVQEDVILKEMIKELPNPIAVKRLHEQILNLYKKEFECSMK